MDQCDESEDEAVSPAKQQQQPQPVQAARDEGLAARAALLGGSVLDGGKRRPRGDEVNEGKQGFDQARFNAGIVRFYETLLKEPIPEKMLRLVDEIAKRERQS